MNVIDLDHKIKHGFVCETSTRNVKMSVDMEVCDDIDVSEEFCGPLGRLRLGVAPPELSQTDLDKLEAQRKRPITSIRAARLEVDARRHWDLFYKRNQANFFKDRKWTWREFQELLPERDSTKQRTLLEVGCGVGNLVFPLIEEGLNDYYLYACDISPRAVDLVKANPLYDEKVLKAFQADVTSDELFVHVPPGTIDVVTMIFVLSAVHPDKFSVFLQNVYKALKPDGVVLFRDYGLYDMTQLRFKPGHLISENFYMRQDGTRYY